MKKIIITLFTIGIGIVGFYFIPNSTDTNVDSQDSQKDKEASRSGERERFIINPQSGTDEIIIDQVLMDKPGFVVIREAINDRPGQIVEASSLLQEGVQRNIIIPLGGVQGINGIEISGELPLSATLIAVVYTDDGDQGFNPILDSVVYVDGEVLARYVSTGDSAPESAVVPNTQPESEDLATAMVTYTDEGFSPSTVEILNGDTVQFVNKSSRPMWVASDIHPAHNILPTFDQFGVSAFGESYQYTFNQSGEWKYHDHVNASEVGVIIVR